MNIKLKIINYKKNEELLKSLPHIKFLDLAIIALILIERNYATVTYDILEALEISESELFKKGKDAMPISQYETQEMENNPNLTIVTNMNGAGTIALLEPQFLKKLSDKMNDDLVIIPSSINEILVAPRSTADIKKMRDMLLSNNETTLSEREVLSNSLYTYNRITSQISTLM